MYLSKTSTTTYEKLAAPSKGTYTQYLQSQHKKIPHLGIRLKQQAPQSRIIPFKDLRKEETLS